MMFQNFGNLGLGICPNKQSVQNKLCGQNYKQSSVMCIMYIMRTPESLN